MITIQIHDTHVFLDSRTVNLRDKFISQLSKTVI